MISRLKGQEVAVHILVDGKPVDTLGPFIDLVIDFKHEALNDEYLGETSRRFDEVFKGARIELAGKVEPGPGLARMVADLGEQGRAQHQRALAEHILAGGWVGCIVLPGETHQQIYLARVLRMVDAPDAPGCSVTHELHRASFDDGYSPDRAIQRAALHGARLQERPPLPTPTLDEVMDQLARSKHPWVAMEVGASGCVDTIIHPQAGDASPKLVVR